MLEPIHFRVLGHAVALAIHLGNSVAMLSALQGENVARDKKVKTLASMQGQFLTIWNLLFQLLYSSLGLLCDVLTLMNKDDVLPKSIKKLRSTFFESIVFPGTLLIFGFFWPVYLYDRNLIFPEFIDRVFSQKSNYIMHIFIVPVALWELVFQPKSVPKSHKINIQILTVYNILYNIVVLYTYAQRGLWPYPLLGMIYGTIYFPLLLISIYCFSIFTYYSQWVITRCIWDQEKKLSQKSD